jgi:D-serine deaminase-like pyridoxal phosphate-dependent protein
MTPMIDVTTKGFGVEVPTSVARLVTERPGLFDGPFVWPIMVLDGPALAHNIGLHADYCRSRGVLLAPHGKTTMAPALIRAQLSAGAWGVTAATISQVRAYRHFGVDRILLANELVDPRGLDWVLQERENHDRFEFWCYVDSLRGVKLLADALLRNNGSRPLNVLLDVGYLGGRTGVRDIDTALAVGSAVAAVDRLQLVGVSAYEGTAGGETMEEKLEVVTDLATMVRRTTAALWGAELLPKGEPILVSAGGSAFFDVMADELSGQWLAGAETFLVLRSGSYITHDDGVYRAITGYQRVPDGRGLRPALQLWAQVVSQPEEGLALVGFGKRDAPLDAGFPVPLRIKRTNLPLESLDGCVITQLEDQHAYMSFPITEKSIQPGDVIGFGVSHPCTAFDKWRVMPVVDDDLRVVDCIETYF